MHQEKLLPVWLSGCFSDRPRFSDGTTYFHRIRAVGSGGASYSAPIVGEAISPWLNLRFHWNP